MSYEKPELLVLSNAANTVRSSDGGMNIAKTGTFVESDAGHSTDDSGAEATSSTSAAYEADE